MKASSSVGELIQELSCAAADSIRHYKPKLEKTISQRPDTKNEEFSNNSQQTVAFWAHQQLVTVETGPKKGRALAKFALLR